MSGPKSSSYTVDRAAIAARQRLEAAQARAELVRIRRVTLAARAAYVLREIGDVVDVPAVGEPPTGPGEIVEEWNREQERRLDGVEARLGTVLQRHRAAELRAALAGSEGGARARRVEQAAPSGPTPKPPVDAAAPDRAVLDAEIEGLVAGLAPDATDDERDRVDAVATSALAADPLQAQTLVVELQSMVRRVAAAARARRESATRARGLVGLLDGLEGDDVDAARLMLQRAMEGTAEMASSDADRVKDVASRARARADREYAAAVLAEGLRELGYEVQEGFRTLLGGPGDAVAYATRDGWPDHAVELRHTDGELHTRVVRTDDADDAEADAQAEEGFCRSFGDLTERAYARGLHLSLLRHQPPGAVPVAKVPQARRKPRAVRHEAPKARTRDGRTNG